MTHVIILAQGTQRRMGVTGPRKQLLPIPGYEDIPILVRTISQIVYRFSRTHLQLDVITWSDVKASIEAGPGFLIGLAGYERDIPGWASRSARIGNGQLPERTNFIELPQPGNSSLRGIGEVMRELPLDRGHDHTIVLLGDVVYSWTCLDVLAASREPPRAGVFAGSSNLSSGGGELWGVAWSRFGEEQMRADLDDALLRHPSFDDDIYQPGQLRRWIVGWRRGTVEQNVDRRRFMGQYVDVDDYTMDVDVPDDAKRLATVAELARRDDISRGLHLEADRG